MSWIAHNKLKELRQIVVAEYGSQCYLCGGDIDLSLPSNSDWGLSIDHVIPRAVHEDNSLDNLRPAHLHCNKEKGARLLASRTQETVNVPGWTGITK